MTVSTPDSEKWMIGPTPGQKVGAGDGNTFVRGESDKIELLLKENHDLGHVNNALTEHNSELQARVKVLEEAVDILKYANDWVEHWQRDKEHNLAPTNESLAFVRERLIQMIDKVEGKEGH